MEIYNGYQDIRNVLRDLACEVVQLEYVNNYPKDRFVEAKLNGLINDARNKIDSMTKVNNRLTAIANNSEVNNELK